MLKTQFLRVNFSSKKLKCHRTRGILTSLYLIGSSEWHNEPMFVPGKTFQPSVMQQSILLDPFFKLRRQCNGGICLGMNYLVLNKTKQNELWLNTNDFRLVNYLFNTGNICSKIGQIVTDFW